MADANSGSSGTHSNKTRRAKDSKTVIPQRSRGQSSELWDGWLFGDENRPNGDISHLCNNVDLDKEIVQKAVAIVIGSTQTRQSVVSLCTKVAELFQKIQRLESIVLAQSMELVSLKSGYVQHLPHLHSRSIQARAQYKQVADQETSPRVKQINVAPYNHNTSGHTEITVTSEHLLTKRPSATTVTALGKISTLEKDHCTTKDESEESMKQELELPKISPAKDQSQTLNCTLNSSVKHKSRKKSPPTAAHHRVHPMKSKCSSLQCRCAYCMAADSILVQTHQQQRLEVLPSIGDYVSCGQLMGMIKYIGPIDESQAMYVGLHLDSPVGTHNGTIHGIHFFSCPMNYGAFVPLHEVVVFTPGKPDEARRDSPSGR